jgi:hypothetical protein
MNRFKHNGISHAAGSPHPWGPAQRGGSTRRCVVGLRCQSLVTGHVSASRGGSFAAVASNQWKIRIKYPTTWPEVPQPHSPTSEDEPVGSARLRFPAVSPYASPFEAGITCDSLPKRSSACVSYTSFA